MFKSLNLNSRKKKWGGVASGRHLCYKSPKNFQNL